MMTRDEAEHVDILQKQGHFYSKVSCAVLIIFLGEVTQLYLSLFRRVRKIADDYYDPRHVRPSGRPP